MTTLKLYSRALLFATLISLLFITSCKEDDDDTPTPNNTEGLTLIASGFATGSGTFVKLWAKDSLFTGYNKLFVQVLDSVTNDEIIDAHVHLMPMMDMGSMMHSAPYENPESEDAVNGLFPCAVVFIMPSDMGWTLEVEIHNHSNGNEGAITLPLTVKDPDNDRTHVVTALNDGSKLVISYLEPTSPIVGINDFEITIHKSENMMMDFPADSSYTVEIEPEMPSMGHGSPNNVNPVHSGNGHYDGKVNFTMTGLWRINMLVKKGAEVADSTSYFEVEF